MKRRFWKTGNRILLITVISFGLCWMHIHNAGAVICGDLSDALKNGDPTLELRLGFEYSNLDDSKSPANKSPASGFNLRTRVGYRSGEFMGSTAYVQMQNVTNMMEHFRFKHDGSIHGDTNRDVIADPDGSRVQQAYLDLKMVPDTTVRVGRQKIILDDHRLIGNIGWRQNGQVFDAVSVTNRSIPDFTLFASYINAVNTIFLDHLELDSLILLNGKYSGIKDHSMTAFCYLLDTESNHNPDARDSITYGLRFTGRHSIFDYALDYAGQGDYEDGKHHNGEMYNIFLSSKIGIVKLGGGFSSISGGDGRDGAFDTLFSTAHKFNGWADQFLSTNGGTLSNGLEDSYVQVSAKLMGIKLLAVYHYYTAEDKVTFGGDYGDEIGFLVSKRLNKNVSVLLKSAIYNSNGGTNNTTKDEEVVWARLEYKL